MEFQEKANNYPYIFTILFYVGELNLYLLGYISGGTFVMALFFLLIILTIFLWKSRKQANIKRAFLYSTILMVIIFVYELPIIIGDEYQYIVTSFSPPEEIVEGTGIYTLSVLTEQLGHIEDIENADELRAELINHFADFYEVIQISNHIRYRSKYLSILREFGIINGELEEMQENVMTYLTDSNSGIDDFFARENIDGGSAGLSLVLGGLESIGHFQNDIAIGVSGAINKKGKVLAVVSIEEKLHTAKRVGIQHIILPMGNLAEANEINEKYKYSLDIVGVGHVEEAIECIEEWNGK